MDFILQSITNTSKLLADGPVTVTKAILNFSDNQKELKIKIVLNGAEKPITIALAAMFQVVSLGDNTSGEFKFTSRQTPLAPHLTNKDVDDPEQPEPDSNPNLNENDIDDDGLSKDSHEEDLLTDG